MAFYRRTISRELAVQTPFALDVAGANGPVKVSGGKDLIASVQASIEVVSGSEAEADAVMEQVAEGIVLDATSLSIHFVPSHQRDDERVKISYVIAVPRATRATVAVANGPVEVGGIDGPLEVQTANGPTRIADVAQAVTLHTINGGLQLERCGARIEVSAVNGPLTLRDAAGPLRIETTNGPIHLERIGGGIEGHALNGPLTYEGELAGNLDLSARNGPIRLRLPADSRFDLDAESVRGAVHSEFSVTEQAAPPADAFRVRLRTENGAIHLEKLQATAPVG
jgi:DUF4097 and DUF4098 domain-containing protein YvlB